MVDSGEARCPCHLYIGQEAIAAGVCATPIRKTRYGADTVPMATIWPMADRWRPCSRKSWGRKQDVRADAEAPCI